MHRLLALNAGSSSIKFALYETEAQREPRSIVRGLLDDRKRPATISVKTAAGEHVAERILPDAASQHQEIDCLIASIADYLGPGGLFGIGHRIVHGGLAFSGPTLIDDSVLSDLEDLTSLAPLHQPRSLEAVYALRAIRPDLRQVACFDTDFHRTLRPPASRYGLPRDLEQKGIRKFGFHGLSYAHIARQIRDLSPAAYAGRTVVAHLGNGASLCAMRNGLSVDTTMGFSALDGLVMGTRCGAIDPGILLYLLKNEAMNVDDLEQLLYKRSGLLGVSGISSDMRELVASREARAREAIDLFVFRVIRETAALAATLGGLNSLVFTGGIGEHIAGVRADICRGLAWLGIELDPSAEARDPPAKLSRATSKVEVWVIAADEESEIARQTLAALSTDPRA
jgi:acetate kinase